LEWCAIENRILITHDVQTMPGFVFDRLRNSQPVLGVIVIHKQTDIGQAINDLELLITASDENEFENQVRYIPLP
jgi:hypothetical protein